MKHTTLVGFGCGAAAGALWGLALLAPALIQPFSPLQLATVRYLTYGLFALVALLPRWRALTARLTGKAWRELIILSFLGNILYYVILGTSVQLCGIAMPTLIVGFLPVTVTVVGALEDGAVPLRRLVPSILLSTAGISCIAWQGFHMASHSTQGHSAFSLMIGLLCAVIALISWSAYTIRNARWLNQLNPPTSEHEWNMLTGLVTGAMALLMLPAAFLWQSVPTEKWGLFIAVSMGMGLLASVAANSFWNRMSRLVPLTMVGGMILFETLFSLIYGFLWEQRWPTLPEALAIILVSSSVLSCMYAHRPRKHIPDGHA